MAKLSTLRLVEVPTKAPSGMLLTIVLTQLKGGGLRCDAPCAYLAELAAGERLTERNCRTGYRLHAVAAATDEQRLARGNIAIGGATVRGHVDVGGGGDGGTEVLRDGFLLGEAIENEVVGVGPSSEGIHDKRAIRVEVELV